MESDDAQVLPAGATLIRIAQAIKRGKAAYEVKGVYVEFANPAAVADVFESCVIPRLISSANEGLDALM